MTTRIAADGAAAPLCTQIQPQIGTTTPAVTPTVNGFTVQSRVVRKR